MNFYEERDNFRLVIFSSVTGDTETKKDQSKEQEEEEEEEHVALPVANKDNDDEIISPTWSDFARTFSRWLLEQIDYQFAVARHESACLFDDSECNAWQPHHYHALLYSRVNGRDMDFRVKKWVRAQEQDCFRIKMIKASNPVRSFHIDLMQNLMSSVWAPHDSLRRGEVFERQLLQAKTSSFNRFNIKEIVWEYEKDNKTARASDQQLQLAERIKTLESSGRPFGCALDAVISTIEDGHGNLELVEHSKKLIVRFALTDWQCYCVECMNTI